MQHFNIQINIQKVTIAPASSSSRGVNAAISGKERDTVELLKLAITADTEAEAYSKAYRMLAANAPEGTPYLQRAAIEGLVKHQHKASCHGPIGELQCGFDKHGNPEA